MMSRPLKLTLAPILAVLLAGCGPVGIVLGINELTKSDPVPDNVEPALLDVQYDPITNEAQVIHFDSNKSNVRFEGSLDGGPFLPLGDSPYVVPLDGDDEGTHEFRLRVRDSQGRTDEETIEWLYDVTPPRAEDFELASLGSFDPHTIRVIWSPARDDGVAPSGLDFYRIYYSLQPLTEDDPLTAEDELASIAYVVAAASDSSVTIPGLAACTDYFIGIVVFDAAGNRSSLHDAGATQRVRCGGDAILGEPLIYSAGSACRSLKTGDLDGDGIPDLVAAVPANNSVLILYGEGNAGVGTGRFREPAVVVQLTEAEAKTVQAVDVADFDNDGMNELAILDAGTQEDETLWTSTYQILDRNLRDPRPFAPKGGGIEVQYDTRYTLRESRSLTAVDLNQNGYIDLVTGDMTDFTDTPRVIGNIGQAGFGLAAGLRRQFLPNDASIRAPATTTVVAAPVTTHDRRLDLVVGTGSNLRVFEGAYLLGYLAPQSVACGGEASSIAVADLNSDGISDFVVATSNGVFATFGRRAARQMFTTSVGASSPTQIHPFLGKGGLVEVGEFNGDSIPDFAVTTATPRPTLSLLVSLESESGSRSWEVGSSYDLQDAATSMVVADFNADQIPEVALTVAGQVLVFATGGRAVRGTGLFERASSYPTELPATKILPGDLNRDGAVDLVVLGSDGAFEEAGYTILYGQAERRRGTGAFGFGVSFVRNIGDFRDGALLDLDFDGIEDLAFTYGAALGMTSETHVLDSLGGPTGTFDPFTALNSSTTLFRHQVTIEDTGGRFEDPYRIRAITSADLTRNGYPDLVLLGGSFVWTAIPVGAALGDPLILQARYQSGADREPLEYFGDNIGCDANPASPFGTVPLQHPVGHDLVRVPESGGLQGMDVADLDADGGPDIAVTDDFTADTGIPGRLRILRNFGRDCNPSRLATVPDRPGFGIFEEPVSFDLEFQPGPLVMGEWVTADRVSFDRNDPVPLRAPDFAIIDRTSPSIRILQGRRAVPDLFVLELSGLSGFEIREIQKIELEIQPTLIIAVDLNGDGRKDLVVGARSLVYVLLANIEPSGNEIFTRVSTIDLAADPADGGANDAGGITSIVADDFDADGAPDLAIATNTSSTNSGTLHVYLGKGE